MKRLFITLLIGVAAISATAQQLKKGEYYFDTDPGVGNATSFTFTQADSIDIPISAPVGALTPGFHRLYIRTQNTNNIWGHSSDNLFYVKASPTTPTLTSSSQLKKGEYYFDTDPGVGNATPFTFTQADSINLPITAPIGALTPGFHKVYVRVMDLDNVWGSSFEHLFYVKDTSPTPPPPTTAPVAAMEYFFDDIDYGPGQCAPLNPFTPMDSVLVSGQVIAEDPLFLTPLSVGIHKLNIRAKDLEGKWSMTKSAEFTVCNQAATASFTQNVSGATVTFTNTSTNSFGSLWIFGDGTTSTATNPIHTYNNGGQLNVGLVSYSGCGNDTAWNLITLNCISPVSSFTSATNNLTVNFTSTSTAASAYSWDFGDGKTSTAQNPSHVFQATGTYTVCLTSSNGCGSSTVCNTVTVSCAPPVAGYNVAINGLTASITNTSTNAYNFIWNFGDATTNNTDYNPVKQYAAPGTYTLKLTVNNGCGANIFQSPITIACAAPTAAFNTYTDGLGVEIENNSLNGTSWTWDFGDGTNSTFKNPPVHYFPTTGTYTITLNVTNGCGTNTYTQVVSVCTAPTAQYTYTSSGTTINFTNTSSNGTSYVWNFGNGLITNINSPAHTFSPGTYNVCLTASNGCGTNQACSNINVLCTALPQPSICMVSVDSGTVAASSYNMIFWDKTSYSGVDSFFIYREITTGVYQKIGAVDYDAMSEYHDGSANPNVTSFRYKISILDTCGNESQKSDYHETIHLQDLGGGNLQWTLYDIENFATNPVSFYDILRDDNSTGNFQFIDQVSGNVTTYTDLNSGSFTDPQYRVKSTWSISCTPTMRLSNGNNSVMGAINTSRSNIRNPAGVGLSATVKPGDFIAYPNPAKEKLTIKYDHSAGTMASLELVNALGQCVYRSQMNNIEHVIDTESFTNGIYIIKIITPSGIFTKKIMLD
ncbi:MAG TPA: PKD domain-containing protein [Bacteroidia bacterium]